MRRKTKIIATIGPASASYEIITALIEAGMNVARLNFSHGDAEFHRSTFAQIRKASGDLGVPIGILQDIQGPKIRVGGLPGGSIELVAGQEVVVRDGVGEAGPGEIHIAHLADAALAPEAPIMLNDGIIRLDVTAVEPDLVRARVVDGGELRSRKGAAFPGTRVLIPAVTAKDERDLALGRELGVDMVAASFVSSGADIRLVRDVAGGVPVIAKIEQAVAVQNLDDIMSEADGIMVARGDLGVDVSFDQMPRLQKSLIARTNAAGLLSITATEMLESMRTSPRATRAEVTDVANAVLDGTDAVMLSAETATGAYPVRAVRAMSRICAEAELDPDYGRPPEAQFLQDASRFASAIAAAAVEASMNLGLRTIVAFTESGSTARLVSKYRPKAAIYAFTAVPETLRRMTLYSGVAPRMIERVDSTDAMLELAEAKLLEEGIVAHGEGIVIAAGIPPNQRAATNVLKLHVADGASSAWR